VRPPNGVIAARVDTHSAYSFLPGALRMTRSPNPGPRVRVAVEGLPVLLACLGQPIRTAAQAVQAPIDPVAYAEQVKEIERIARQNYMNYRAKCAQLHTDGHLEAALECYTVAITLGLEPAVNLPGLVQADEAVTKTIHGEVKARDEATAKRVREQAEVTALLKQAETALGGRQLVDAKRLVDEVLKRDPGNKDAAFLNGIVNTQLRTVSLQRVATWTVLGTVAAGALVAAFVWFRKAKRVSSLEMIEGPQPGDVFRLEKETTVLGALEKEADWPIVDLSRRVSRRHCEITRSKGRYFLIDVSTNGTSVNGRPVTSGEPLLLRRGDLIELTPEIVLKFR